MAIPDNQAALELGKATAGYNAADPASVARYKAAQAAAGGNAGLDTTAAMNKGIGQAQSAVTAEGQMTPEQIAARSMSGVDKSSQLATPESMARQSGGLGGDIDYGMQAAIANRQNKIYGSSLNEMSQMAGMNSKLQSAHQNQAALAGMASVEDLKTQAANTQLVKYQNDQAARNSLLNSILGLGGTIAGGIISGGAGLAGMLTAKGAAGMGAGSALARGIGGVLEGGGGNTQVQSLNSGGQGSANYFGGKG